MKKGVSFEYIAENRFFTGADSYTLSITFPLKGCQKNLDIFGHINRKDNNLDRLLMDCEIYDRGFHVVGAVNIVEISELEVKTQFLQGKSASNYASALDTIYINEIQIGYAQDWAYLPASWFLGAPGQEYYKGYVSLPWVNNTSGNMQNALTFYEGNWAFRDVDLQKGALLSCQYYLIYALEIILDACGFNYDLSVLKNSDYKYLVIFNTFPHAWEMEEWSHSLPHWTVAEFLEQIELFTNGVFDIDTRMNKVTFSFNKDVLDNQKTVRLEKIVDEYTVEITDSSKVENTYLEQSNLKYSEADHQMQNFYACDWAVGKLRRLSYMSYDDMLTDVHDYKEWKDIIEALKGFQCIVVWVPFNGAWGQFDTKVASDYTKSLDPTRLVNAASGGNFELCGDLGIYLNVNEIGAVCLDGILQYDLSLVDIDAVVLFERVGYIL